MMTKEEAQKLWEQVKANRKALDECTKHFFEPHEWTENGLLLRRAKCYNCGGVIDVTDLVIYRQGIQHAGGGPAMVQSWDMTKSMPKRPT